MVTIINDVANRTNMLALNASIEASHAGEAGKGFSVVASEIRKLASETNRSSKQIIENVRTSISDIQNSRVIIHELEDVYGQISIEIRTVAELLQNIIWDVNHVSEGTRDIVQTLESVNVISSSVGQAMEKVGQLMATSSKGVEAVTDLTGRILSDIEAMLAIFEAVMKETEKVDGIGRENIDYVSSFYQSIKTISQ
jgi:methyl-accepting chemotaxis protein